MPPADALLLPGIAVPEDADARDDRLTRELVEFCSRFNVPAVLPDTIEAGDAWGANCGPMALAAVLGLPTVEAARPLVRPFRGFMSPTDMLNALAAAARAGLVQSFRHVRSPAPDPWPMLGIVRIQWFGPWMDLANQRAAYRYTGCDHRVDAEQSAGLPDRLAERPDDVPALTARVRPRAASDVLACWQALVLVGVGLRPLADDALIDLELDKHKQLTADPLTPTPETTP